MLLKNEKMNKKKKKKKKEKKKKKKRKVELCFLRMGKSRSKTQNQMYLTQSEMVNHFGGKTQQSLAEQKSIFKRLPFYCCSISLSPFEDPVCNAKGIVFDIVNLMAYLRKYKRDPISGEPATAADYTALHFHKDAEGRFVCPVTQKQFTDHTTIVAIRTSGHVYAKEAIDELCIKPKHWADLLTDEPFTRADIITIQDPHDNETRALANFHHLKEGHAAADAAKADAEANAANPARNINVDSTTARVMQQMQEQNLMSNSVAVNSNASTSTNAAAAQAPGFTSSAFSASDMKTDDDALVRVIRTKAKGYVSLVVAGFGAINLELHCDLVSKTCENFLLLAERGAYDGSRFHRLIKGFMIQGGKAADETAPTSQQSAFGKPIRDEFHQSLTHSGAGILAMANSGPHTGTRQFYITFKATPHLDKKHTVFGRVVGGMEVLRKLETLATGDGDVPKQPVVIERVDVLVNPLSAEAQAQAIASKRAAADAEQAELLARHDPSNRGQWFSNPVPQLANHESTEVGKYMTSAATTTSTTTSTTTTKKRGTDEMATAEAVPASMHRKKLQARSSLNDFSGW
jgi:peptidyl-prolyl cis-trans isomerase-like protein 2